MDYRAHFSTRRTPQSQPIPGTAQVANSAGGYAFAVDDWTRLQRFLILGAEGGTFYIGERKLTIENAEAVARCLADDGPRVVRQVVAVSESGRAPRCDPALFVLAMAAGLGDRETVREALAALPRVARIGTHLMHFAQYVEGFRGWGRGLREAIADWYNRLEPEALAYQLVKYQQRDGWAHRDLLRLAHPKPPTELHARLYGWATDAERGAPDGTLPAVYEQVKRTDDEARLLELIREHRLTHEMVPSRWLGRASVWEALLQDMPMGAMVRNVGRMTANGLLTPTGAATRTVVSRLADGDRLRRARIHPLAVLAALRTYAAGQGHRGRSQWAPLAPIIDALDGAFYAAFGGLEPAGRRIVLALDVSGSMTQQLAGIPSLTCAEGSAAMALITAATEPAYTIMAFADEFRPLAISPRQRLDDVLKRTTRQNFGATDCALPMLWAVKAKVEADAFVVYTDSETWRGQSHPVQALREYRETTGIPAKLVVVGMASCGFTIADPNDAGMLDVVGFDTATPSLLADFIADRLTPPA